MRIWVHSDRDDAGLRAAVLEAGAELAASSDDAEAIVWAADEPPALAQRLHRGIKWVQLSSAGIEDWFEAGVIDTNRIWTAAKGVYAPPIAEYVVGAMLMFARSFPEAIGLDEWQKLDPQRLRGSTVGIVGAGLIGEEILRLLEPFDVQSLALSRSGRAVPRATHSFGPSGLDDLIARSDYLVLAAPETDETRGLLDAGRLAQMKPGSVLINVGRGTIVDTDALVRELARGNIRGAVLDVTDPEPLPSSHPLWRTPNAIVTCHTSSTSTLGASLFAERVRENAERYLAGQSLLGLVTPRLGY